VPQPPLREWQKEQLELHGADFKRAYFASPRLGKTRLAVEEMCLQDGDLPIRGVVCSPLVVAPQWEAELANGGLFAVPCFSGSREDRSDRIYGPGVVVVNDDMLAALLPDLLAWGPDFLVGDESHRFKSPTAKRAKAFRKLAWKTAYVRILTGTPTPNHYGDLWGQMAALDPQEWGTSYEKFARQYLLRDFMFPSRVIGYRDLAGLQAKMLKLASVIRREDVFGPDQWQTVVRKVVLPDATRIAYKRLAKEWLLEGDWGQMSADHILKRIIRLQQLAAGYLVTDDGTIVPFHDAKVKAVLADLEEVVEAGEKAVLFHRFRWEGETYQKEIQKICPTTWRISGDTPAEDRAAIIERFRDAKDSRVCVIQTQAGGLGVSFATGTHVLFTSRGFSFSDDEQARDRVYEPGEPRVVTYYETEGTIDGYIAKVLSMKRDVHTAIKNADREDMAFGRVR
jgi:superfamily II DNA or RNA helicase